jgi:hypothetical protein
MNNPSAAAAAAAASVPISKKSSARSGMLSAIAEPTKQKRPKLTPQNIYFCARSCETVAPGGSFLFDLVHYWMRLRSQQYTHVELLFEFSDADVTERGIEKYRAYTSFSPKGVNLYPASKTHFKAAKWVFINIREPPDTMRQIFAATKVGTDAGFSTSGFFNIALNGWLDWTMNCFPLKYLKKSIGYGTGKFCSQCVVDLLSRCNIGCATNLDPRTTSPDQIHAAVKRWYCRDPTSSVHHVMPNYFEMPPVLSSSSAPQTV